MREKYCFNIIKVNIIAYYCYDPGKKMNSTRINQNTLPIVDYKKLIGLYSPSSLVLIPPKPNYFMIIPFEYYFSRIKVSHNSSIKVNYDTFGKELQVFTFQ